MYEKMWVRPAHALRLLRPSLGSSQRASQGLPPAPHSWGLGPPPAPAGVGPASGDGLQSASPLPSRLPALAHYRQ